VSSAIKREKRGLNDFEVGVNVFLIAKWIGKKQKGGGREEMRNARPGEGI